MPKVSVIIPVFNTGKYINACVDSILAQTLHDIELILVDDGSTDECPAICDEYAIRDSRVKVIHKDNAGQGFARNTGLDIAEGEFVCFLDSDDFLALNALEYSCGVAEKESADQVRFLFKRFSDDDNLIPRAVKPSDDYAVAVGRVALEPILDIISPLPGERSFSAETTASSCSTLYRRSVIEKNKIRFLSEREVFSEDAVFNIDFAVNSGKNVFTANRFYFYRHNPSSHSSVPRADRVERAAVFAEFLAGKLRQYGYEDVDTYVMGYVIGEMRSSNLRAFESNLPYGQKKEIFLRPLELDYIKKIRQEYPMDRLSAMQRIAFTLHVGRCYWFSYFLTKVRSWFKE